MKTQIRNLVFVVAILFPMTIVCQKYALYSMVDQNQNLKGIMYDIRDMGDRVVSSIEDLSYITDKSLRG